MSNIDVSVIIPTFDRLWCLPRAIESCRGTTCRTEIIVVDDGSHDGTWEWLGSQPDLTPIHQDNQGQPWAVNRGLQAARGRFVRFLDSDDALAPGVIDRQFEAADRTGAALVYSRVDAFDLRTHQLTSCEDPPLWDDFIAVQLGESYQSHFLGMLFDRELAQRVPRRPEFALREDRAFLLEIGLLNPSLALVPGCGGYWTKHQNQMHDRYTAVQSIVAVWQMVGIYQRVLGALEERGELTERRRKAAAPVLLREAHHLARVNLAEASSIAAWAMRLDPSLSRGRDIVGLLYRTIGFANTERLLNARRAVLTPRRASTQMSRRYPGDPPVIEPRSPPHFSSQTVPSVLRIQG